MRLNKGFTIIPQYEPGFLTQRLVLFSARFIKKINGGASKRGYGLFLFVLHTLFRGLFSQIPKKSSISNTIIELLLNCVTDAELIKYFVKGGSGVYLIHSQEQKKSFWQPNLYYFYIILSALIDNTSVAGDEAEDTWQRLVGSARLDSAAETSTFTRPLVLHRPHWGECDQRAERS